MKVESTFIKQLNKLTGEQILDFGEIRMTNYNNYIALINHDIAQYNGFVYKKQTTTQFQMNNISLNNFYYDEAYIYLIVSFTKYGILVQNNNLGQHAFKFKRYDIDIIKSFDYLMESFKTKKHQLHETCIVYEHPLFLCVEFDGVLTHMLLALNDTLVLVLGNKSYNPAGLIYALLKLNTASSIYVDEHFTLKSLNERIKPLNTSYLMYL